MNWTDSHAWKAYLKLMDERPALFDSDERLRIVTDSRVVDRFVADTGRPLGVVYESHWHILVVDLVEDAGSHRLFGYERIVQSSLGEPVVVIPTTPDGRLVLLRQYRHAIRRVQCAFPRGFGEDGLTACENAAKELLEELGCTVAASDMELLGTVTPDSGSSQLEVTVITCEINHPVLREGYEGIVGIECLAPDEFGELIASGRINDGISMAAYALWTVRRGKKDLACDMR